MIRGLDRWPQIQLGTICLWDESPNFAVIDYNWAHTHRRIPKYIYRTFIYVYTVYTHQFRRSMTRVPVLGDSVWNHNPDSTT